MNGHDDRLAELYRQSSQETPSAQIDRAVLDLARKSVHRKLYSPFGASWLVRGATLGVMVLGVLLVLTMPDVGPDLDLHREAPGDALPPSSIDNQQREERLELDETETAVKPLKRRQPATEEASRSDFHRIPPKSGVGSSADGARGRVQQAPPADTPADRSLAAPAEPVAEKAAAGRYLQTASFGSEQPAIELRDRLVALGYRASVAAETREEGVIIFRVRIGPFVNDAEAGVAMQQLDGLGLKTRPVREE